MIYFDVNVNCEKYFKMKINCLQFFNFSSNGKEKLRIVQSFIRNNVNKFVYITKDKITNVSLFSH
jgi:hypothetical protein